MGTKMSNFISRAPDNFQCWINTILATLTTLAIIIIAVAIQAEVRGHSNKEETGLCNVVLDEFKYDFQPNQSQMERCSKSGLNVKFENIDNIELWKTSLFIHDLHIESGDFQYFDIGILCDDRFKQTKSIYLSNVRIISIRHCEILNDNLKSLDIHKIDTDLTKFLHSFSLNALIHLNVSHNPIRNALNRFYFVNMTNIQEIILINCQIDHLPSDTFHMVVKTIKLIDLRWNHLIRLPFGFSLTLTQSKSKQFPTIRLSNNPWYCDCHANNDIDQFIFIIKCLENCQINNDRSVRTMPDKMPMISITQNQKSLTKSNGDDTIELKCDDLTNNQISDTIKLKRQTYTISIHFDQISTLNVTIAGPLTGYLIWFNDSSSITAHDDDDDTFAQHIECVSVSERMFIDNVIPGSTYTFCVIPASRSDSISPFDCVAYYVAVEMEIELINVWLSIDQKPFVISIFCAVNALLILFGILFGIFILRRYPNCLKHYQLSAMIYGRNDINYRSNRSPQSVFSLDDNIAVDDNVKMYITSKPFESIDKLKKGQSIYEIALGVSQFDLIKSALDKTFYESKNSLNTPALPPPPLLPEKHVPSLSQIHEDDAENNNYSEKNSKTQNTDKGIDLPAEADNDCHTNQDPVYVTCNFDSNINNNE